jgi:hypothetical protein
VQDIYVASIKSWLRQHLGERMQALEFLVVLR